MKNNPGTRFLAAGIALLFLLAYGFSMITSSGNEEVIEEDLKSKDLDGFYIFTEMLGDLDFDLKEWKIPDQLPEGGVLVLLVNSSQYKIRKKAQLIDWVSAGNILVQCGSPEKIDTLTGFVTTVRNNTDGLNEWKTMNLKHYHEPVFRYDVYQVVRADKEAIPYVYDDSDLLVCGKKSGKGEIITISDFSFLTNMRLLDRETAILVSALFAEYYESRIYYVGTKATAAPKGEGNPILVLFSGRIRFISVHLLLILFLYYMSIGIRFGPPELKTVSEQRFLKRHLGGLASFFERVNAKKFVLENMQDYYRYRFLKNLSLSRKISGKDFRVQLKKEFPDTADEISEFLEAEELPAGEIIICRNRMEQILDKMKIKREEK